MLPPVAEAGQDVCPKYIISVNFVHGLVLVRQLLVRPGELQAEGGILLCIKEY